MYERYCALRDNLEVKDIAVARETGITPSTFSDWKKGKSTPNADKLVKIARYLDTTVEYLVTGESQPAAPQSIDKRYDRLLKLCDLLNAEGLAKVEGYAGDLAENEKYIKDGAGIGTAVG